MIIYSIYKATNKTNGQSYIGFTNNYPKRKLKHLTCHDDGRKTMQKFYNAMKQYGSDSFDWEIVYQSLNGEHCEVIMETFFIKYFDSIQNGYNTLPGASQKRYEYITSFYDNPLPVGLE